MGGNRWTIRLGGIAVFMGILPLLATMQPAAYLSNPLPSSLQEEHWVDSVYQSMDTARRIGQLFVIRAHSDKTPAYEAEVANLISTYHVGGLCFFQGTPQRQALLTNAYQAISEIPLLVAMDAEWGLGMRLSGPSVMDFPRQITLGAVENDALIYDMGKEVARQLRRIGVHVNFAPVADINNNPNNPVINYRSFGEDRLRVTQKSAAYMRGLQEGGVMACAKHFPGHGDTDTDSHKALPVILHQRERLDSIELYPFRELVRQGMQSVMVAHLHIPALDDTFRLPTTLSRRVVTDLLRKDFGFDGLVFTDAMEMKGVTNVAEAGEAELQALLAGNDVILMPAHLPTAFRRIEGALRDGILPATELEAHVKRILRAKYRMGLTQTPRVELEGLERDIRTSPAEQLLSRLISQSLILVRNREELIPFKALGSVSMASINLGGRLYNPFQETLLQYADMSVFHSPKAMSSSARRMWIAQLRDYDVVIAGLFDLSPHARSNYGLVASTKEFLEELSRHTKVVVVHFGNPYGLKAFDEFDWVVQANQEDGMTQIRTAEGLMGHALFRGRMPVTASSRSPFGTGLYGDNLLRLGYGRPELSGLSPDTLGLIDTLIAEMLRQKVTPGGQILVVKDRKVVFERYFGRQTYADTSPVVDRNTLYDLASVTKVAATTLALMKLHESGAISVFQSLGTYWPASRMTRKERLLVRDLLHHQAGLSAWVPFYQRTLTDNKPSPVFYRHDHRPGYRIPVAENLWLKDDYPEEMVREILSSRQDKPGHYLYSDLGFILLKEMTESVTGEPFDRWLEEHFYRKLGLRTLGFHPLSRFPRESMAPTEEDHYFRMQTIQGHVHDMTAALFGGVSGHAGLFSNAYDLAVLFQMLLNGGVYGGHRFLKPETIRLFTTRCPDCARRGMGFDMKDQAGSNSHISPLASDRTFGHLGFTGTCVWADPEHDLIFIFLSNRTYPSMASNKLQEGRYRQRIQTLVYSALSEPLAQ